ncbi:MAG: transglycosylase domain-containing protein, partial [Eubacteriales bacterium]|nr:transglycosylase domain-containing protein [Eubacteriales bacterium]
MATKKNKKLKIIILIVLSAILLPIVGGGIFVLSVVTADDYVRFDESKMPKLTQTLKTLTIFDDENRLMNTEFLAGLDVNALSDETINAFLVTEDKRFFKHKGVDLKRIIGATINNVKHGGFKEGASTLTQQLAKNVFLTNEKSLKRKINEVDLARQIEKRYTKNEILTFYLNTVYFGSGAYGLNSAAE